MTSKQKISQLLQIAEEKGWDKLYMAKLVCDTFYEPIKDVYFSNITIEQEKGLFVVKEKFLFVFKKQVYFNGEIVMYDNIESAKQGIIQFMLIPKVIEIISYE